MFDPRLVNTEAEQAAVGALFLEDGLIKDCTITPDQLFSRKLRKLLAAMKELDEKGKPIDVISVVEQIGANNLEDIGGISYITKLAGSVPTTANFHYYQGIVKEYAKKRQAIEAAKILIENAKTDDINQTLREGISRLMEIEDTNHEDHLGDIKLSLIELYFDCEKEKEELLGIPTGFQGMDNLTGGFQKFDFVIVGARPSMGKTAFALNIALNAAEKDICLFFSLEMPVKQLLKRAASTIGEISSVKMRNPKQFFVKDDWSRLSHAMGKISNSQLHIFDRVGMNINYIWSKVRKVKREYGDDKRILVIIDYLQLIPGENKYQSNRQIEISEINRALKLMAREMNIVVMALSQLSRGVESRQDKRPMLSDLRESGQIEQDADVISFLYRDDYYQRDVEEKDIVEIIVAKQRNGPIGTVKLGIQKEFGRFEDYR
ncbi:replicative DNA helicase [Neobacillus sp. PS3-34]|uniref:replicative DNA helicase n=1 Tax=Neobacillus sp. PS3-34 TaxID=3070678 RepID=UPI0027DF6539|nr:replicative DNA helicase [Neobacillus sp. PS3-34]WML48505.1 replicative DNA helicase [Neobacillus sp. PS3-34]